MRFSRRALTTMLALGLLSGCGYLNFIGDNEDPRLPGERVSVMLLEDDIRADPAMQRIDVVLPTPTDGTEWPQAGGNAAKTPPHGVLNDSLTLAWRADVGQGGRGNVRVLGQPVAAAGKVFAIDARGVVSAFDAASGDRVWRFDPDDVERAGGGLSGGLAYANNWLFVTESAGTVFGLDARTGEEIWRRNLKLPLRAAPTVAGDRVLVLSADNQLFALNGTDGSIVWQHAGFFETAALLGSPSPAVNNNIVLVPYSSGEVYALRLDNGQPLWSDTVMRTRRTLAIGQIADIEGHPVLDGTTAFVAGHGGEMASFDIRNGARLWDQSLASTETPASAGDFLFVLTTRGEVLAVLKSGGGIRWVSQLPRFERPDDSDSDPVRWTGPVLAGNKLVFVSDHEQMLMLSPRDGSVIGDYSLPGGVAVPPISADGTLYLLDDNATLLAYR
ncbi:MAG: PQQ-binding-like beta-propeller repeat protein [Geminicoccaceae bacterium]